MIFRLILMVISCYRWHGVSRLTARNNFPWWWNKSVIGYAARCVRKCLCKFVWLFSPRLNGMLGLFIQMRQLGDHEWHTAFQKFIGTKLDASCLIISGSLNSCMQASGRVRKFYPLQDVLSVDSFMFLTSRILYFE